MAKYDGQLIRLTSLSIKELKEEFHQAPPISRVLGCDACDTSQILPRCFYVEEIGVMAITSNHAEAIDFLLEATDHDDKFVRFNAYGHLGDVDSPRKRDVIIAVIEDGIKKEKDEKILNLAKESLAKLKGIKEFKKCCGIS